MLNHQHLFLAPMAGVTDKPFRQIVRRFGHHPLYTEMIGVESAFRRQPQTMKMMDIAGEENIIIQLVGADIPKMVHVAKMAQDRGAAGIGINMGCPVRKLITNGSGAALMNNPDRACLMAESVVKNVSVPVSVKTRIGWDKDHITILDFAKRLEGTGISALVIHGRTKEQGYGGAADWDIIGQVKSHVRVPVIANGDIVDVVSARLCADRTQADGLMIGRGALGRPWLLQEITAGRKPRFKLPDVIRTHLDNLMACYGAHGLLVARKHLAWYAAGRADGADFCWRLYRETKVESVQKLVMDFF